MVAKLKQKVRKNLDTTGENTNKEKAWWLSPIVFIIVYNIIYYIEHDIEEIYCQGDNVQFITITKRQPTHP